MDGGAQYCSYPQTPESLLTLPTCTDKKKDTTIRAHIPAKHG